MKELKVLKDIQAKRDKYLSLGLDERSFVLIEQTKKISIAIHLLESVFQDKKPEKVFNLLKSKSLDLIDKIFVFIRDKKEQDKQEINFLFQEILSFIDVLYMSHHLSASNYDVFYREILKLKKNIDSFGERTKTYLFEEIFRSPTLLEEDEYSHTERTGEFHKKPKEILREKEEIEQKQQKELSAKKHIEREEKILHFLKENPYASLSEIAVLFPQKSKKTLQRALKKLIEAKLVVKEGDKRWATYRLQ